jgi:1-acyl-sn-glycerol-3-phosphate acyltransferase
MSWLRSLLFNISLIVWTLIVGIVSLPIVLIRPKAILRIADIWTGVVVAMLGLFCGIHHKLEGAEYIAQGVVYAAKHQSAWETIALWNILHRPVFVLKRELLSIPVFGSYLRRVPHVAVDRKAGSQAMRQVIEQSRIHLQEGRSIIIFPEGTRTAPGETRPYKQGVASLYEHLKVHVVPVALNSGLFWRRNAFIKRPGLITVRLLPPMLQGLDRDVFLKRLQETIEAESTALLS